MDVMTTRNEVRTPDTALAERAHQAVMRTLALPVWGEAIVVKAENGVVELSGYVRTRVLKEKVQQAAWRAKGVREVKNNLRVDTELEVMVAQALGAEARTQAGFPGILVGSAFGEIYLKGNVNSQDLKKAAEEVAKKVPGVLTVVNQLVVPEPPKPVAAKPVAKPAPKPAPKEETESENEE